MSNDSTVKCRPFDKVECCFDIVAVFGNNHVQFVSTLSKGRNFVGHCCRKRQHCCQKRQQCRSNIRHCRKNRSICSIRQCWDVVAGVDGASTMLPVASTMLLGRCCWCGRGLMVFRGRGRRRALSTPMKSRPILLDMTATCAAADLPSPTHVGAGDGGMTTLDYGLCEVLQADPDWRRAPDTVHRPSTTTAAIDCFGDRSLVGGTQWNAEEDVEFDSRLCWAAYHHHVPACVDTSASGDARTSVPSPTTSSFRPSPRTTATASAAVARTHVYEMPHFQS